MKYWPNPIVATLCIVLLSQCAGGIRVPLAKIPSQAWRPGDFGEVKRVVYVERSRAVDGFRLRKDDKYDIHGTLRPGDIIQVLHCIDYPLSTTGGTHLELKAVTGSMKGTQFTDGIIFESIVDSDGEVFAAPSPGLIERVSYTAKKAEQDVRGNAEQAE
jgi:hypothetical protein